ncbi:helix-turn-helix domain-containing protein [Metabacillus arenae]|uniref:Helix-turn-helix domain-containing protein n=1 Tax=Metabacillus arenae TaxID=2771434 RepID=A0A926NDL0_9BACI|nr:RodZ domain-containing protein [Metabacillus arenae]MBD1379286.1 helix-turn-helix domain-containing protein [Metabacillus arenae]
MTELGIRLKEAREEKNYSLDDLQTITKIQKRYLIALEEGNYQIIPGKFYVRAFIKQYSEAVGLNPEEIFDVHKNDIPSSHNDDLPEQLSRVKTQRELPKSAAKLLDMLPKILIILGIVAIAVIIWFFYQRDTNPSETQAQQGTEQIDSDSYEVSDEAPQNKDESKEETPSPAEEKEEPKEEPKDETAQNLSVTATQGKTTTYELSEIDKFELEIGSKGNTWVSIKNNNGETFHSGVITSGNSVSKDLTGEASVRITIGFVPDTEIKVNGQVLKYELDPAKNNTQNIVINYKKN